MTRPFTGWHMTMILVAFFGVVIAVNFLMASQAVATFGGTVVENSYVASQRYNDWLAAARKQSALRWTPTIKADRSRHVVLTITTPAGPLAGARITATATHPLGALPSRALSFVAAPGGYRSVDPLPPARWMLHIDVEQGATTAAFDDEIAS